ncbi:MAG: AAA family ATPase, partial [Pseudomonadota bacterium]
MRFDRLRLCGFKSFVEPVDVRIDPGLTGIVGPNGCGKSNLVEGLRWLMGASSAKAMRASGMDEVIFAGTAGGRPARSWAEVSLDIDNSERRAPAQFNDTDNLAVSRRVVRKADGSISTYSINGKEVRARDVQMLFADASTGATSPALVRQGQISELINAKPSERRRFLEEAAGVTGLAARRHEAQLRLKAAADNLERLDDVIGELDLQSEQLARQARKASKYKALTEDIKETARKLTAARISEAHRTHQQLQQKIGESRAQVAELASRTASADREASEKRKAVDDARERERRAATAMTEATAALRTFENEEALRQRAAEERAATLKRLSGDEERETELLREADAALKEAQEVIADLERTQGLDPEISDRLDAAYQEAAAAAQQAEASYEALQTEAAEARAHARAAEQARLDAEKTLTAAEASHRTLSQKLGDLPAADPEAVSAAEADAKRAAERLAAAEAHALQMADALNAARGKAQDAQETERQAREVLALLDKEMAVLLPLVPRKTEDTDTEQLLGVLNAPEDLRAALASALGEALHAALGEGEHAWTKLGASATEALPLPAGVQNLTDVLTAPPLLSRRFQTIGLVDRTPTDDQLTSLKPGQLLLNRAGDLWSWDGYRRIGDRRGHLEELLAATARLQAIEHDRQYAATELELRTQAASEAKAGAEQANESEKEARQAVQQARTDERSAAEKLSALSREQDTIRLRRGDLEEQTQKAAERLEAAKARMAKLDQVQSAPAIDEAAIDGARQQREAAREAASAAKAEAAEHQRQRQARSENLARRVADAKAWTDRQQTAQERLGDITRQRQAIQEQVTKAEAEEAEDGEGTRLELALEEAKSLWERRRDALGEAENAASVADRAFREAEARAASAREGLAELGAELRGAEAKLQEELEEADLTFEEANVLVQSDLAELRTDDLQAQLGKLERERERLGAVNLLAADEQVQVDERLSTLRRERTDCEQAASQLQTAVNAINREGRQRLLTAFDAVNGHFRELCTSLFGGGEAHLKFVDNDDPLAA